jgi:hypothetical protein
MQLLPAGFRDALWQALVDQANRDVNPADRIGVWVMHAEGEKRVTAAAARAIEDLTGGYVKAREWQAGNHRASRLRAFIDRQFAAAVNAKIADTIGPEGQPRPALTGERIRQIREGMGDEPSPRFVAAAVALLGDGIIEKPPRRTAAPAAANLDAFARFEREFHLRFPQAHRVAALLDMTGGSGR